MAAGLGTPLDPGGLPANVVVKLAPFGDAVLQHSLAVRDGPLAIDPQTDGPLHARGNLEITSGTGRVVARVTQAKLCGCGASASKPFCDGSHARVGFRSS